VTYAASGAAVDAEQQEREAQAADGRLVLSVRTVTAAKAAEATGILHAAGATAIETLQQDTDETTIR
jgi:hypothetical protein